MTIFDELINEFTIKEIPLTFNWKTLKNGFILKMDIDQYIIINYNGAYGCGLYINGKFSKIILELNYFNTNIDDIKRMCENYHNKNYRNV